MSVAGSNNNGNLNTKKNDAMNEESIIITKIHFHKAHSESSSTNQASATYSYPTRHTVKE